MGNVESIQSFEFQGMRTDIGDKLLPAKYFKDVVNFNEDDIVGANKILAPIAINSIEFVRDKAIDGIFNYSYLDSNNKLQKENIVITGGKVFKNFINSKELYSGLSEGVCDFTILNDKLFITNGKDYPIVYNGVNVYEMGAPEAIVQDSNGGLIGNYYYEITFVTAGGEERTGTKSNTVSVEGNSILLNLPIGYDGVTARRLYRTDGNGYNLKLVAEIADNETLTYVDSLADSDLTSNIPSEINNECPKPYFFETTNFRIVGCVSDKYPTQAWATDVNVEVFDGANFIDVSNRAKDNSHLVGMKRDYDKVIIASEKQVYLMDASSVAVSIVETRANVGCLNGYSMVRIPSDVGFDGGIMFLASDKTIRLFNGNFAQPVATSLDNLKTDNYGQPIKTILERSVTNDTIMYGEYYNFKYHLILGSIILVYDIRTQSWFTYDFIDTILNGDYSPENFDSDFFYTGKNVNAYFNVFSVIGNEFYIGRRDCSLVEKMYSDNQYRGVNLKSKLEFPFWGTSEELKYFKEIHIYYQRNSDIEFDVTVNLDDGTKLDRFTVKDKSGGDYDNRYFSKYFFESQSDTEDYRVLYINKYSNWIKVTIESNEKPLNFRGMRIIYDKVSNKEIA